ncbi:MAG: hypothetical protein DRR08_32560 [Candidatus Parabeggiatoa sp. nov. 2]|nr:MAG: hypothetical protein B6247_24810 [Beggiatoa sp. 4572_84]RKZ47240.1 MAG: hypothetical protein DRR08_32560 [Gammaproteobacteria bacterium]
MAVSLKIRARRLLNPLAGYRSWEDSEPSDITSHLPLTNGETALGIYTPHPQALKDAIVVTSHGLWVFYDNSNAKFVRYTEIVSTSEPSKTKKGTTLELKLTDSSRLTLQVIGWNEEERLTDAALFLQFLIYVDRDIEKQTGKPSQVEWYTLSDSD